MGYATIYGDMAAAITRWDAFTRPACSRPAAGATRISRDWMMGPLGEVIPTQIISCRLQRRTAPDQKDQDSLPPYEVLDAILCCFSITKYYQLAHIAELYRFKKSKNQTLDANQRVRLAIPT